MIDLRSDTLTRPTTGMLAAMAAAPLGDDVYAEDPSVNALEARVAALLGHEAGLFCATGSLSNLLGVWCLVRPGEEVVCDSRAHIARAEMGAHAALHGVTMRTWPSATGVTDTATIAELITPDAGPHLVSTAAVALENTHNFGGGTIQPYQHLVEVSELCLAAGVGRHLDGARLWNAHAATGIPLADYGQLYDTVSVCFSKGLGTPIGSVLVSSAANIARARVQRKRLGGGWRQAGLLAAAADYALDHHLPRLADDHVTAATLAAEVAAVAPQAVDLSQVSTNIVILDTGDRPAAAVAAAAAAEGVRVSALGPKVVRAVTWQDITLGQATTAGQVLGEALAR